jgi:ribosomal protein RSM22 (predicted rRNA methylase)
MLRLVSSGIICFRCTARLAIATRSLSTRQSTRAQPISGRIFSSLSRRCFSQSVPRGTELRETQSDTDRLSQHTDSPPQSSITWSALDNQQDDATFSSEDIVRRARNDFKDILPEGLLDEKELALYIRLYGQPQFMTMEDIAAKNVVEDTLQKANDSGHWEVIEEGSTRETEDYEADKYREPREEDIFDEAAEEDEDIEGLDESSSSTRARSHPFTAAGRFSTTPSTIQLPLLPWTEKVTELLFNTPKKHLIGAAERTLGGPGLPYSPSTPQISRSMEQRPIALGAHQSRMSDLDADAYLAAVMPQTYASVMSVLVEVRKRLGSEWIRKVMNKEGGPLVMDAGAGGAGALAFRDVLKAEWDAMHEGTGLGPAGLPPAPLGKAVVVTGSDTLRYRASRLLENTSFIPRLPDHIAEDQGETSTPRKQYDLILAPHTLWPIKENHRRKNMVQTLWSLLNPEGGILVLLEKGVPRGFEVVAGAREMLLTRNISSPGSETFEINVSEGRAAEDGIIQKETGMIIAPCTNHTECPMYKNQGVSRGRRDWCHFSQRYIRPAYLQTVLGAKKRNHDDVDFSYLAVQRGVDLRQGEEPILQGDEATTKAFQGYGERLVPTTKKPRIRLAEEAQEDFERDEDFEDRDDVVVIESQQDLLSDNAKADSSPALPAPHPLALPRTILNPLKRKSHIFIDVCTPSGTFERWVVNRKAGRQAFRDARKARSGDLWALGGVRKEARRILSGTPESSKDKKERRKVTKDWKEDFDEAEIQNIESRYVRNYR